MLATCALLGSMPGSSPMLSTVRSSFPLRGNHSRYDNPRRRRPPLFPLYVFIFPCPLRAGPPARRPRYPARTESVKAAQSARLMTSAGPCGSLESRTATIPGRLRATSTQFWPPLKELFRHSAAARSCFMVSCTSHPPSVQALDGHYLHYLSTHVPMNYLSAYVLMTARESSGETARACSTPHTSS